MMYGNHMNGSGWVLSILVTIVIVGLIVAAVVWLVRNLGGARHRGDTTAEAGSARELLDRRVASGEITVDEHQALR
jgi:uncharacterized membrane protein